MRFHLIFRSLFSIYSGYIFKDNRKSFGFLPLLRTGYNSGTINWQNLVGRGFLGMGFRLNPNPPRVPNTESFIIAGKVHGDNQVSNQNGEVQKTETINAVVVADVDFISEQFFQIRETGMKTLNFDNITFFLNSIDLLANDSSFVDLRKKRIHHRTLEAVESQTNSFVKQRMEEEQQAEQEAMIALQDAQGRLDAKVAEVQSRTDLDSRTKQIMVKNIQEVESRRFEVLKTNIEAEKEIKVASSKEKTQQAIRSIQTRIKTMAVILPPIPVLVIGVNDFYQKKKT